MVCLPVGVLQIGRHSKVLMIAMATRTLSNSLVLISYSQVDFVVRWFEMIQVNSRVGREKCRFSATFIYFLIKVRNYRYLFCSKETGLVFRFVSGNFSYFQVANDGIQIQIDKNKCI